MSKEMSFFIYMIERYAEYKHCSSDEVLKNWDRLNLTPFIYDMYELYHIEAIENAFEDIDRLVEERQKETYIS